MRTQNRNYDIPDNQGVEPELNQVKTSEKFK